ncbi:MAG: CBS-domain-containing membrane protein [Neolewinella sp.]|jgi:CBS-domain-containing membrane protein
MSVEKLKAAGDASCQTTADLHTVAGLLWQHDCGCIAVVDDSRHVKGVITDRDICMASLMTGKQLADLSVADCMSADVVSARDRDSLREAEMLMRARGVRRLPVLDEEDHLVGVLSCNDLLRGVDLLRGGDDGSAKGLLEKTAVHLVRALAMIGQSRAALPEVLGDRPGPAAEESKHMIARAKAKSSLTDILGPQALTGPKR